MYCFKLSKEDQVIVRQLGSILKNTPAFLDNLQLDENYCKNLSDDVKEVIHLWILAKEESDEAYEQELSCYLSYFALDDNQKNNLKWLCLVCESDPSYKEKIIVRYNKGIAIPEEKYAVKYLFGYDTQEYVNPQPKNESSCFFERDYSSLEGMMEVVLNIELGKYVRQQLHISDGIVTKDQEEKVLQSFTDYCTLNKEKVTREGILLVGEMMKARLQEDIETFEKNWVTPHLTNLTINKLSEEENFFKPPYQK